MATTVATVKLWGKSIGAVSWDDALQVANFEYDPDFQKSAIELSPFMMPLNDTIYSFPTLPTESFKGMPGMLADSLPDAFGNTLIDAWLAQQGRESKSFNPVERLCYIGNTGMGALEYFPAKGPRATQSNSLNMDALVSLAGEVLSDKNSLSTSFDVEEGSESIKDILKVGTSAGGARAKAIIAWNPQTQDVRSGQTNNEAGYSHWILKFDGVKGNKDKEAADPEGYGLIEYAYYLMAVDAGIHMTESRLLKENNRAHFMTRRFDRLGTDAKLHMQSLAGLEHFDYKKPGAYSYEQAFQTIRKLGLTTNTLEQQFKRMAFNIIARNQDDHVKNISFLMAQDGRWRLSPAYDVTYSYNPDGPWTGQHQMSLNEKRDDFSKSDFEDCGKNISLKRGRALEILQQVHSTVSNWQIYANKAGVSEIQTAQIQKAHRLNLLA
jgi:serine/threonine-protein kinase HipA